MRQDLCRLQIWTVPLPSSGTDRTTSGRVSIHAASSRTDLASTQSRFSLASVQLSGIRSSGSASVLGKASRSGSSPSTSVTNIMEAPAVTLPPAPSVHLPPTPPQIVLFAHRAVGKNASSVVPRCFIVIESRSPSKNKVVSAAGVL